MQSITACRWMTQNPYVYVALLATTSLVSLALFKATYGASKPVRVAVLHKTQEEYDQDISERELQAGMEFTSEQQTALNSEYGRYIQALLYNESQFEGIQRYGRNGIISFAKIPGFIFKPDPQGSRYENMVIGKTVTRIYGLNLLEIPNAKPVYMTYENRTYRYIAERKLDVQHDESLQEELFDTHAESLTEAICQFALFICKTGCRDVEWRNNPVLNQSLDQQGRRKIALLDLEDMRRAHDGLFGGKGRGLVALVTAKQGQMVADIAQKEGRDISAFPAVHEARKNEISFTESLKRIYHERGIQGSEPIQCNVAELPFPNSSATLFKKIAERLLTEVNECLAATALQDKSLKGRRCVRILLRSPFDKWTVHFTKKKLRYANNFEEMMDSYLGKVIQTLFDQKVVLGMGRYDGSSVDLHV